MSQAPHSANISAAEGMTVYGSPRSAVFAATAAAVSSREASPASTIMDSAPGLPRSRDMTPEVTISSPRSITVISPARHTSDAARRSSSSPPGRGHPKAMERVIHPSRRNTSTAPMARIFSDGICAA